MMGDEGTAIPVADPFARRLMAQYLERRERDLKALSSSLAEADFEAIALTAHRLYGSGSAYGLDEVTRLGGELEKAAESRKPNQIAALLEDLRRYLRRLKLK
jgi:HPt (histidine-containing phosphotransfer) domain-containing protein